jgi:hypothetical protein
VTENVEDGEIAESPADDEKTSFFQSSEECVHNMSCRPENASNGGGFNSSPRSYSSGSKVEVTSDHDHGSSSEYTRLGGEQYKMCCPCIRQ